jgi:malto-oligosyltrehalose trehalohydrolase
MTPLAGGWHELFQENVPVGTRYRFQLPNGLRVPDPASRFQPEDVHGPSELVDTSSWEWNDAGWPGRPWHETVIYELHIGTFTTEGTFQAAAGRLDYLADLGVTAIQLMPVADFYGGRNWGYDGVLPYAPDSTYGRPEDLKALVEAAHARGLMVFLDVVYNHFGPEGNYLSVYAPEFFSRRYQTPWGDAINFESPAVREFFIQNALYWVREFHLDGLRLDAVHAILDDSTVHVLTELAKRVRRAFPERHVHLMLENGENHAHLLERDGSGRPALYTAQWNDDVHHVLHTAVTGEDHGYYREYYRDTGKLGRALAEGFAFQGEMMTYGGRARGSRSSHLEPTAFISFLQNHDQVGNRAFGDRLHATTSPERIKAAAATYLLLPQIPLLFMGEEWGASTCFSFFCDFDPVLGEAVRVGRRLEFAGFPEFQEEAQRERIPDPQAEATFESSKLRWAELRDPAHLDLLEWYRRILRCRRERIIPLLTHIESGGTFETLAPGAVRVSWAVGRSGSLVLVANLSGAAVSGLVAPTAALLWAEGGAGATGSVLPPWSVGWWTDR